MAAPGIDVLLLSRDRTILFGPPNLVNKPLNIGSPFAASRVITAFPSERWPDGKDYLTAIVPTVGLADLSSFGWSLLVRLNADDAMAPTREVIRSFWVIVGAGAVAALVLLFCAAQWLSAPLRRLADSADAIAPIPPPARRIRRPGPRRLQG
ncbi:hypothetical protein AC628_10570 [Bradyrhizobium sp. NAS96.2]|nr:hypothetical protein AC628_10570 [Bradyrhizobium sp. NAS96.2]